MPPAPDVPSPTLWGDEACVRERFRDGVAELRMVRGIYPSLAYPFSVPEVVEFWCQYNAPIAFLSAALDKGKQTAFRHELEQLFTAYNSATDGTTLLGAEYLEVTVVRT